MAVCSAGHRPGAHQPDLAPYNPQGSLFGAVVNHPVTVS
jgi:hypothetical protein